MHRSGKEQSVTQTANRLLHNDRLESIRMDDMQTESAAELSDWTGRKGFHSGKPRKT